MMERCDASFALSVGSVVDWERAVRERVTGPDVLPASEFTQRSAAAPLPHRGPACTQAAEHGDLAASASRC